MEPADGTIHAMSRADLGKAYRCAGWRRGCLFWRSDYVLYAPRAGRRFSPPWRINLLLGVSKSDSHTVTMMRAETVGLRLAREYIFGWGLLFSILVRLPG